MLSPRVPRSTREHGQVVVLFALLIPILFAIGAIVIDVGNWYVHKRHLQTQVDAAALASGPQFVGCFQDAAAANAAIASRALAYAGDALRPGKLGPNAPDSTTNLQLAEPGDVRVALNSSRYWGQADGMAPGTNGYGLDYTISVPGDPCSTESLDVKATDDAVRPLWGLIPLTPSPKTHAKVEIHDLVSERGMLPWAVPEIDPARVAVLFVNENNGAVFDWQYLDEDPLYDNDSNGATPFPFSAWTTSGGMEPVTLVGANNRTSVVVLVSKNDSTPSMGGTLAAICAQDPGLVKCFAGASQTSGVSFIHAYKGSFSGTMTSPQARQVELFPSGCTAADLSAPHFTLDGDCAADIQAVIDFGVTGDPRNQAPVCALVDNMTWSPGGLGGALGTWTGSMSLPTASGRNELTIQTHTGPRANNPNLCPNGNNRPNSPSLGVVAAPYVANAASGRVQYLKLTASLASSGTPVGDANSVEMANYDYRITVGLPKPLSITNYPDPPLVLRMASPAGSQNQAFDCDKNRNYEDEIETGCLTTYAENYVDPDGPTGPQPAQWNNLLCSGWNTGNLPPPTIGPGPPPYPADCVMTETGDKTGQQRQGLAARFESPCVPNNWPDNAAEAATFFGPDGGGYGSDPRYVTLIITDDTAFQGSGNEPLPIKYFAGFYVTGWDIGGATNGCADPDGPSGPLKGNDCHPIYGCSYSPSRDNGDVWGYFVNVVVFSGDGDPGETLCTFGGAPAACVAVLVE